VPGKQGEQPNAQLTIEILTLLLKHGANPNLRDKRGRTALHQAAKSNNIKAVDFLLNNMMLAPSSTPEAPVYLRSAIDAQSSGGETPLMLAVDEGNT